MIKTLENISKYMFGHIRKSGIQKIIYIFIMIFIFSIIYTFFENKEFAGWIELSDTSLLFEIHKKKKFEIFSQYAQKYKNFIDKDEFINMPIVKIKNALYILNKTYIKKQYNTAENIKISKIICDIYAKDNEIAIDEFISIPIKLDIHHIDKINLLKVVDFSNKFSVTDYFDRLYYSTTIQTTLGFGDIFPADKMLRFFTMLQALSTILIIVV